MKIQEAFKHDPGVQILLATDAAGEGINLQRAHLMVNYDLPLESQRPLLLYKKRRASLPSHGKSALFFNFIFRYFRTGSDTTQATTQQRTHSKIACTPTSSTMNINAFCAPSIVGQVLHIVTVIEDQYQKAHEEHGVQHRRGQAAQEAGQLLILGHVPFASALKISAVHSPISTRATKQTTKVPAGLTWNRAAPMADLQVLKR